MMRIGDVLTVAFSLAWKCGVVTIAVALIATISGGTGNAPDRSLHKAAPQTGPSGVRNREMVLEPGSLFSNRSIEDEYGNELLQVTHSRRGEFVITQKGEFAASAPSSP
jgi:hypothetical protein